MKHQKVKVIDRSKVKERLAEEGIYLADIANSIGLTPSAVSKFLRGENNSRKVAEQIKVVLGVDKIIDEDYESPAMIGCTQDSKALSVRLPKELEDYVVSRPNRSAWIRKAIQEKMERELEDAIAQRKGGR